jgi:hypothetical protein
MRALEHYRTNMHTRKNPVYEAKKRIASFSHLRETVKGGEETCATDVSVNLY